MSSSESFYWHDYETFGADPSYDRPSQFAGVRTDADLNPVGEPLVLYSKPTGDYVPHPAACLITGITPQEALAKGVAESDFIARIEAELSEPGTCGTGYNSLRFDDTVTRFTLYRNLRNPYAREFGKRRSRWDLIDVMRTAFALRPEGLEWPKREDGLPSFRLEDLARANGLAHEQAHDALSDVYATIALAKRLKEVQPKLFDWLYRHRTKASVKALINIHDEQPLLHISGMFGAARAHVGLVLPVAWNPRNANELICVDLSVDPEPLIEESSEDLRRLLYASSEALVDGEVRPGIKTVHINRCPVLLPARMVDESVASRAQLDKDACYRHLERLQNHHDKHPGALRDKLRVVLERDTDNAAVDPDIALYSGGFIPDADRQSLDRLLALSAQELAQSQIAFEDQRLEEMVFRYRARNHLDTLDTDERERWSEFCYQRLTSADGPGLDLESFQDEINNRLTAADLSARDEKLLSELQAWGDQLLI